MSDQREILKVVIKNAINDEDLISFIESNYISKDDYEAVEKALYQEIEEFKKLKEEHEKDLKSIEVNKKAMLEWADKYEKLCSEYENMKIGFN